MFNFFASKWIYKFRSADMVFDASNSNKITIEKHDQINNSKNRNARTLLFSTQSEARYIRPVELGQKSK